MAKSGGSPLPPRVRGWLAAPELVITIQGQRLRMESKTAPIVQKAVAERPRESGLVDCLIAPVANDVATAASGGPSFLANLTL
jgi:hypothetical protein